MFNSDVKKFLQDYLEKAVIVKHVFSTEYPVDNTGLMCMPSGQDQDVILYLRNPQKFNLSLEYFVDGAEKALDEKDISIISRENDNSSYTLTFPSNYLYELDGTEQSDLSGVIKVFNRNLAAQMEYESYPFKIRVNSPPPELRNCCLNIQIDGSQKKYYYICFCLPILQDTVHQNDTHSFFLDDREFYFDSGVDGNDNKFAYFYDSSDHQTVISDFITTEVKNYDETPLASVCAGAESFSNVTELDDYIKVWYKTGIEIDPDKTEEIKYSLKIYDLDNTSTLAELNTLEVDLSKISTGPIGAKSLNYRLKITARYKSYPIQTTKNFTVKF